MKKYLFMALSLLFLFACKNPQNDGAKPSDKKEEFKVNFSVKDDVGGNLTAKIKGEATSIATGKKVVKDAEVVFTAMPDANYSVESWTLDGTLVEDAKLKDDKKEFTLKIAKEATVVVKFKKNESDPQPKDIQIDKIILGYPNISPRDGKTVLGGDLNENTAIDDFEVPDATFPIQVYHKIEFTVEEVFVSFDGGSKEKLTSSIQKTLLEKRCTLVENHKTPIVIDITAEGYKPLKLTFNVTYKKATKKYVDDLTNITITTTKSGKSVVYGAVGEPIAKLTGGQTTINVSTNEPSVTLIVNKGTGGQPSADIKIDDQKLDVDFENGKNKLTFKTSKLTKGIHSVKITITKEGYEPGEYHFNLNYKPLLSFKSLTINDKTYNDIAQIKQITLEVDAPNPVNISGEANEAGAVVSFKRLENKNWVEFTSPLDLQEGDDLSLRMYAKLDGYATTFWGFRLKRNVTPKVIVIKKIEVDGTEVTNGAITVEKQDASVRLAVFLKQKYESISFKINNVATAADLDEYGMIATFNDFAITKDGALQVTIEASAPNFESCTKTITITHTTSAQQGNEAYITSVGITPWDYDEGEYGYIEPLTKKGANWEGSLSSGGPHRFTIEIDTKDKDITDITSFKLYMKDANSSKVYFDKITGKKTKDKVIKFERYRGTDGQEINLPEGTTTLDVKLYYGEEVVESCQFIVKR